MGPIDMFDHDLSNTSPAPKLPTAECKELSHKYPLWDHYLYWSAPGDRHSIRHPVWWHPSSEFTDRQWRVCKWDMREDNNKELLQIVKAPEPTRESCTEHAITLNALEGFTGAKP